MTTDAPTGPLPLSVMLCDAAGDFRGIAGSAGERLLDALLRARAPIIPACGGRACCGGCRIRVETVWRDRLAPPGRSETRLLPHLHEPHPDDRLACQIELSAALDGLAVRIIPKKPTPSPEPLQTATGEPNDL